MSASFSRIPAQVPIEFLKQDGLPFEATAVMRVDGVNTPMDFTGYTGKFSALSKAGAVVYESEDVTLTDSGEVSHTISPETVQEWTLCPDRYYLQVFPPVGNPLTLFSGPFNALNP